MFIQGLYISRSAPIDDWSGMKKAKGPICELLCAVLRNALGSKEVSGLEDISEMRIAYIPTSPDVQIVYLCKTYNNGTVYAISDFDFANLLPEYFKKE